jgi:hypothetical protein
MSDNIDVIVTIEPEFIDVEPACKALDNVGEDELWQLLHVGLINGRKIGKRTVLRLPEVRRFTGSCGSWEPRNV